MGPFDTVDMNKIGFESSRELHNPCCERICHTQSWKMHIVNVRGPIALSNLTLPHVRSAWKVRIINISSKEAITSLPMMTAYSSTKASLLSFTSCFQRRVEVWIYSCICGSPWCRRRNFIDQHMADKDWTVWCSSSFQLRWRWWCYETHVAR